MQLEYPMMIMKMIILWVDFSIDFVAYLLGIKVILSSINL